MYTNCMVLQVLFVLQKQSTNIAFNLYVRLQVREMLPLEMLCQTTRGI